MVLSLPLLRPQQMTEAWNVLKGKQFASLSQLEKGGLASFKRYMSRQWMIKVGPVELSVAGSSRRTNNEAEVHNR
jgi:hypothetical protein